MRRGEKEARRERKHHAVGQDANPSLPVEWIPRPESTIPQQRRHKVSAESRARSPARLLLLSAGKAPPVCLVNQRRGGRGVPRPARQRNAGFALFAGRPFLPFVAHHARQVATNREHAQGWNGAPMLRRAGARKCDENSKALVRFPHSLSKSIVHVHLGTIYERSANPTPPDLAQWRPRPQDRSQRLRRGSGRTLGLPQGRPTGAPPPPDQPGTRSVGRNKLSSVVKPSLPSLDDFPEILRISDREGAFGFSFFSFFRAALFVSRGSRHK